MRDFTRRAADVGVVAVLHDLNLAAQYADRLLLMRQGRVVAVGAPAEVLSAERVEAEFDLKVHVLRHPGSGAPLIAAAFPAGARGREAA